MTLRGLGVVAKWELRQHTRSRRLLVRWVVWASVLTAIALLIVLIMRASYTYHKPNDWVKETGPVVYGLVVLFVLALALAFLPPFCTSVDVSERESATLAALQVTKLTPGHIVGGKLVAACVVAAVFLGGALPALSIAVVIGHIEFWRALVCLLVVYAEMVVLCAINLGWSAVPSRLVPAALTYVTIFVLTIGSLIAFALLYGLTSVEQPRRTWGLSEADMNMYSRQLDAYYRAHTGLDGVPAPAPPLDQCTWQPDPRPGVIDTPHTERFWWILAINPFVFVSDAAPLPSSNRGDIQAYMDSNLGDPMAIIAMSVREARMGYQAQSDKCFAQEQTVGAFVITPNPDGSFTVDSENAPNSRSKRVTEIVNHPVSPVGPRHISMGTPFWPIGLASHFVIAALFYWIAWRRVDHDHGGSSMSESSHQ